MSPLDTPGSKAHGYLARLRAEGRFPALIQLQYAGVYALNARADAQRAAEGMARDQRGLPRQAPVRSVGRHSEGVPDGRQHRSREIDGKTIVLTDRSMRGRQSLVLPGLRPEKITGALVCLPAGSDTNGDLRASGRR